MIVKSKKNTARLILIFIIVVLAFILLWRYLDPFFSSLESIKEIILKAGPAAPFFFIFLVALQVLFAPIPGQVVGLVGGFVFGWFWGTVYSMIGLILGSYTVFALSRKYGRNFIIKFIDKEKMDKFDKYMNKESSTFVLFLIYLLPALPDDIISFFAGLTKIKMIDLLTISALGRFPGFLVLNLVGAGLASEFSETYFLILFALAVLSLIGYLNKSKFEKAMLSLISRMKKFKR